MTAFDPEAPLPGSPEPWAASTIPAPRDGPPYAMTEMIAAEPALAERLAARLAAEPAVEELAGRVRDAARAGMPVTLVGCGTSEHAAEAIAGIWTEALDLAPGREIRGIQALELAVRPPREGLVVAVSHEGGTTATNEALRASAAAGAHTALITVGAASPGGRLADIVIATGEQDQSWCHTVGYVSPIVAGTVVGARISGAHVDAAAFRDLLRTADDGHAAAAVAAQLASATAAITVGSGADHASARELALKLAEGAHLATMALPIETILHGHLAAAGTRTALILVLVAGATEPALRDRSIDVLRAARTLGMPSAALLAASIGTGIPADLTPAGRLAVPATRDLAPVPAALLGSAIPLQLLAERMARARAVNPDAIGRDDAAQAAAHG